MTENEEPWWVKFDWGPELGLEQIESRAFLIADMCGDTDEERDRYYDEIASGMLRYYNRLN
jgi:hypothetical protein